MTKQQTIEQKILNISRFPDMYQDQSYAAQMGRLETFDEPVSERLVPRMAPKRPTGELYGQGTIPRQATEQGEARFSYPEEETRTSQDTVRY